MVCLKFIILFCLSITRTSALTFFPEKFVIAERGANVTLTCKTDKDKITWRLEKPNYIETISQADSDQILSGQDLTLIGLQEDQTGNFTCWNDAVLEDYTYLLLDTSKEATGFSINCTAETFSCTEKIKCAWTSNEATNGFVFRIRNTRDNGDWVSQSVDEEFFLPHSTNLYSEESERLLITGEAVSDNYYMKTDYSFYLRDITVNTDFHSTRGKNTEEVTSNRLQHSSSQKNQTHIVKPANPNVSICNVKNEGSDNQLIELEVKPPSTWPEPHSFFPLKHQLESEIRHDGKRMTKEWEGSKTKVKGSITKLRVRCRDLLLLSQWSEWSEWKNVTKMEKGVRKGRKEQKKKRKDTLKNKQNKEESRKQKNRCRNRNRIWANV